MKKIFFALLFCVAILFVGCTGGGGGYVDNSTIISQETFSLKSVGGGSIESQMVERPVRIKFDDSNFSTDTNVQMTVYDSKLGEYFDFLKDIAISDSVQIVIETPESWNIDQPFEVELDFNAVEGDIPVVVYSYGDNVKLDYAYLKRNGNGVISTVIDMRKFFPEGTDFTAMRSAEKKPMTFTFLKFEKTEEPNTTDSEFNKITFFKYNKQNSHWIAISQDDFLRDNNSILFVHGFQSNHNCFDSLAVKLKNNLNQTFYAIDYYTNADSESENNNVPSISQIAEKLSGIINSKNTNFDIVAHSMGGLVSRSCLEQHGIAHKVTNIITLGTPHDGIECGALTALLKIDKINEKLNIQIIEMTKHRTLSNQQTPFLDILNQKNYNNSINYYSFIGTDSKKEKPFIDYWVEKATSIVLKGYVHDGLVIRESAGYDLTGEGRSFTSYGKALNHEYICRSQSVADKIIEILGNTKPTVSITTGPTGNTYSSSSTFNWGGYDADGSISHYFYRTDNSGWIQTNGTSYTWSGYNHGSHTFYVKAVDNRGSESDVDSRSFTYGAGIAITTQPQSQSKTVGQSVTFSVAVTGGSGSYYYQWKKNGVNINGANSSSYTKTNLQTSDSGQYSVYISDTANNSAQSNNAQLTVGDRLQILSHPGDANKSVGQSVTFNVVTSGGISPYYYQWRKNGANISGANGATYVRYNLQTSDSGQYSVVVTDSAVPQNVVTSNNANLNVTNPTPEPGDDEVIVFIDFDYGGAYQRLTIEGYYEPEAIGLPNDSISSIKIGRNVKAVLYKDTRYNGDRIRYPTDEHYDDHNIERIEDSFNNQISSIVVMNKNTSDDFKPPIGSSDPEDQIILYEEGNFHGNQSTLCVGHYRNSAEFGISNDSLSSMKIGRNVKIRIYKHNDFQGDSYDYPRAEDGDHDIETIEHAFENEVSSLKIAYKNGSLDE